MRIDELSGFRARWSDGEEAGVVEGASLVVQTPASGLRVVPFEAIDEISSKERELRLAASVESHGVPRHRSVRRLGDRWRVDVTLDAPRLDSQYWLAHCEGFLVNSPTADIGVVDEVMLDEKGQPEALLVNAGGFRRREIVLAAEDVVEIIPEWRMIGIRRTPEGQEQKSASDRTGLSGAVSWLRRST